MAVSDIWPVIISLKEQIPTWEILGLFQQFPWNHRGASSMHRSCSVTLRSFEEVGKEAGNSGTEQKRRTFFSRQMEGTCKNQNHHGQSNSVWQLLHIDLSHFEFSQKAEYSFFLRVLADDSLFIEIGHILLYLPLNPLLTLTTSPACKQPFFDGK